MKLSETLRTTTFQCETFFLKKSLQDITSSASARIKQEYLKSSVVFHENKCVISLTAGDRFLNQGFFLKKMLFSKLSTKDNVLVTEALNVKLNLIIKSNIKSNAKWKDEHYII